MKEPTHDLRVRPIPLTIPDATPSTCERCLRLIKTRSSQLGLEATAENIWVPWLAYPYTGFTIQLSCLSASVVMSWTGFVQCVQPHVRIYLRCEWSYGTRPDLPFWGFWVVLATLLPSQIMANKPPTDMMGRTSGGGGTILNREEQLRALVWTNT